MNTAGNGTDPASPDEPAESEEQEAAGSQANAQNKRPNLSENRGNEEVWAELRRRIFDLKTDGMSIPSISKLVGKSETTVRHHYHKARLERLREIETQGWKPKAGEISRKFEKLFEIAKLHLNHLTTQRDEGPVLNSEGKVISKGKKGGLGSVAAAIWTQTAMKLVKEEYTFLMELGVMPRAREKLDITIQDARSLSLEELQAEASRLSRQLSTANIVADSTKQLTAGMDPIFDRQSQALGKKGAIIDAKVTRVIEGAVDKAFKAAGIEPSKDDDDMAIQ